MLTATNRMSPALRELVANPGSWIDGAWRTDGPASIQAIDPTTEDLLAEVPAAGPAEVAEAVAAARRAFDDGPWPRMRPRERAKALERLIEGLDANRGLLAELGMLEVGSTAQLSNALHADGPIRFWEWFADAAVRGPRGGWEEGIGLDHTPVVTSSILYHEPIGVVAAISAYNFPQLITAFKLGGALASGCSAVLMPSPRATLSAVAFMRILEQVDLPAGLVNLVIGEADAGRALTEDPGVDLISFTGSVTVGRQVMAAATRGLKKVVLELGGKSPNLLLEGIDVEATVGPSILRFTRNTGQGCGATTRTLVPRADYDRFVTAAAAFIDSMVVGDPCDPQTTMGPLIRRAQLESVQGYVDRALSAGAEIVAGGGRCDRDRGYFMRPVLVGGVTNDAEICQEELFGPVGAIIPYDTLDEAVALANGTRYGLNANIWGPTAQALALARRIRGGTVTINGGGGDRPDAPWGGTGESGIGFDRGEAGFSEFFHTKHVQWPVG